MQILGYARPLQSLLFKMKSLQSSGFQKCILWSICSIETDSLNHIDTYSSKYWIPLKLEVINIKCLKNKKDIQTENKVEELYIMPYDYENKNFTEEELYYYSYVINQAKW